MRHTHTHTHCARIQTAGNAFLFWFVIEGTTTTTTTTGTAANDAAASLSGRREKGATYQSSRCTCVCVCATTCSRNIYRSWQRVQSQVMKNLRSLHEDVMKSAPTSQPGRDSERAASGNWDGERHRHRLRHRDGALDTAWGQLTLKSCAGSMRCMYLFSSSSSCFLIFTVQSGISTVAHWMSLCPEPWARPGPALSRPLEEPVCAIVNSWWTS